MNTVFYNVALAIAWAAVTGVFSPLNLLLGFLLGGVALLLIRNQIGSISHFERFARSIWLALVFLRELVKSSVSVAIIVISPWKKLQPAIIAYPISVRSDLEITMLANMITLTPGTLSIDVSDDRQTLYVHAIDAPDPDAVIADIKESFERRIQKVFER